MLQILGLVQGDIITTRANDVLGKNDYQKIEPLIHNIVSLGKRVKWYFELEAGITPSLTAFSDGTAGRYLDKIRLIHAEDLDKIALVGPKYWEQCMRSMVHIFHKARVQYFGAFDKFRAFEWLKSKE